MKRDMDLIREILLWIEENIPWGEQHEVAIEKRDPGAVGFHVVLLREAGLIVAHETSPSTVPLPEHAAELKVTRLTWDGCEFLDAARDEKTWSRAKAEVSEKSGGLSFEIMKSVLIESIKRQLFGGEG